MNQEDLEFRKKCQKTHQKVRQLLKKNNVAEASTIIDELEKNMKSWREYEKSIMFRSRLVKSLYADLTRKQRIKISSLKTQEAANE